MCKTELQMQTDKMFINKSILKHETTRWCFLIELSHRKKKQLFLDLSLFQR